MAIFLGGNRLPVEPLHGHLQIISNGRELEVQPSNGFMGGYTGESFWSFKNRPVNGTQNGSPNTPNYGTWGLYAETPIDLGDRNEADTWKILTQTVAQFSSQMSGVIPYQAAFIAFNSNSFANTLLSVIGVDIGDYIPGASPAEVFDAVTGSTLPFWGFPGVGSNALDHVEYSPNFRLSGGASNDVIHTGGGNDRLLGGDGADDLAGGAGDDSLYGGTGDDLISAGDGSDFVYGGGGADVIYFDALDTLNAGAGRDIAYLQGENSLTIDMAVSGLEVLISSVGNDVISGVRAKYMVSAGAGDDLITIDRTRGGQPAILWGGEGADTFDFTFADDHSAPLGIMVVDVPNLTESNFAQFQASMIEMAAGFRWGRVDAIILNPDSQDRVLVNGTVQGTSSYTHDFTQFYVVRTDDGPEYHTQVIESMTYQSGSPDGQEGTNAIAGNYDVAFLGGGVQEVFGAAATPHWVPFWRYLETDVEDYVVETFGPRWWDGVLDPGSATQGENSAGIDWLMEEHFFAHIGNVLAYTDGYGSDPAGQVVDGNPFGVTSIEGIGTFHSMDAFGPWFVLGGSFDGTSLLSNGNLSVTMPEPAML